MSNKDPELGEQILTMLREKDLVGPFDAGAVRTGSLLEGCRQIVWALGGNTDHGSIQDTPHRMVKMYSEEICYGLDFNNFPRIMLETAKSYDEIILERNIKVHSLCMHHFVPIIGVAHVAYIPKTYIVGLSKLNRVVDFFSRRPQIQERLGEQIAYTLQYILETPDIAVVIKADHFCVKYRGVQDPCSDTVTSVMMGRFRTVPEARSELMSLIAL